MYVLAKFGGQRSHKNGDNNSYINSYMDNHLGKRWAHRLDPPYCEIFKSVNIDLKFRSLEYGWQKNEKKKKNRQLQSVMPFKQTLLLAKS